MNYRIIPVYVILLLSVLLTFGCGNTTADKPNQNRNEKQTYPVLKLDYRSITLNSSYPTTLEGYQTVEIRPRVQGYIVDMMIDEGATVKKGQILFKLNNESFMQEVRSAKANIKAAKAGVETAVDEVERLKPLVKKDIISEFKIKSARNQLQSQKASLAQAQAALKNAQVNLSYTYVKSPASGVIGTIPYRVGSLVNSQISNPLTIVSDISKVYAYFSMSEEELLQMTRSVADSGGNKTIEMLIQEMPEVNLFLADNSKFKYKGNLNLASGHVNAGTGSVTFRALFPNPQKILRSGGSGVLQIPFHHDSTIVIPKKATYEIQNKTFVYALTDSNKVESVEIKTLPLSTKKLTAVRAGLSVHDEIILEGIQNLKDGIKIKPNYVDKDTIYNSTGKADEPVM